MYHGFDGLSGLRGPFPGILPEERAQRLGDLGKGGHIFAKEVEETIQRGAAHSGKLLV